MAHNALTTKQRRQRAPAGAGLAPQPARPADEGQTVVAVSVVYSQVPDELADRFVTTVRIDRDLGSLIRASGVLYAMRALIRELEAQGLLADSVLT
jgi:hypothetical protein